MAATITTPQIAAQRLRNLVFNLPTQVQQQITNANNTLANGVAAQGNNPAVSAADIATALGATDLATIQGILSALSAAINPTTSSTSTTPSTAPSINTL